MRQYIRPAGDAAAPISTNSATRPRIEIASNYADGLVLLNASQPALLIANVLLPGGSDGLRLAEEARRVGVPTLLISGHPEVIAKQEAQGLPFLSKPFRLPEFRRANRTLIKGESTAVELDEAQY